MDEFLSQIKEVTHLHKKRDDGSRAFIIDPKGDQFMQDFRVNLKAILNGDLVVEQGEFENDGESKDYFGIWVAPRVFLWKAFKQGQ